MAKRPKGHEHPVVQVVALEAVFLASVQVNLLAEQELTAMRHLLHGLCMNAGVQVAIRDEHVQQLLTDTDIRKIAVALDQGLDARLDA